MVPPHIAGRLRAFSLQSLDEMDDDSESRERELEKSAWQGSGRSSSDWSQVGNRNDGWSDEGDELLLNEYGAAMSSS